MCVNEQKELKGFFLFNAVSDDELCTQFCTRQRAECDHEANAFPPGSTMVTHTKYLLTPLGRPTFKALLHICSHPVHSKDHNAASKSPNPGELEECASIYLPSWDGTFWLRCFSSWQSFSPHHLHDGRSHLLHSCQSTRQSLSLATLGGNGKGLFGVEMCKLVFYRSLGNLQPC